MAAAIAAATLVAATGVVTSLRVAAVDHRSMVGPGFNGGVFLLFTIVGAVVVAARPSNRVGWAMLAGGALSTLGGAGVAVARHGIVTDPGSVPGVSVFAIGGQAVQGLGWMAVTLVAPAYFPDIRALERRWVGRALAVIAVASVLDPLLDPNADLMDVGRWHNPVAPSAPWDALGGLAFLAHIPLTLVTTVAVVRLLARRWRSGDALRRQQILLFAIAAALPFVAAPIALATPAGGWIFGLAALPLPIAMGFAVLTRDLYDLRSAANRTLVWVTLSAIVALLYALVIGGAATLLHVDRDIEWLPWAAAIVVAVSFAPLRDALQRAINRLTYGRWDQPYDVLAALGQRLEASADVDRLLADVVCELRALGLQDVSIRDDEGRHLGDTLDDGDDHDERETIELSAFGAPVGSLSYRRPDNPLRDRDRQLLDDLAGHLGGVVYARRVSADLQQALERVVLGREEERRRLRRDLHDGLGPALAGHVLRLDLIAGKVEPGAPASGDIETLRSELRATVLEVRRVVEGLRPPALDELGLSGALRQVGTRLGSTSGVSFEVDVDDLPPLSAAAEVATFRIATEAMNNVVRHAGASRCHTSIATSNGHLRVVVEDDGRGLPQESTEGHGMQTMRERAEELGGSLHVVSANGTTVTALLPLSRPSADATAPAVQVP